MMISVLLFSLALLGNFCHHMSFAFVFLCTFIEQYSRIKSNMFTSQRRNAGEDMKIYADPSALTFVSASTTSRPSQRRGYTSKQILTRL